MHSCTYVHVLYERIARALRDVCEKQAPSLDIPPPRFFAVNIPAIVLWASAHVLPGVFAVQLLHRYGGLPHHGHIAKHAWILAVVVGTIVVWLVLRMLRKRREGQIMAEPSE